MESGNAFGALFNDSSDEDSSAMPQKKSVTHKSTITADKILDSLIGETEADVSDWETVSKKKIRKTIDPLGEKSLTPSSPEVAYFSDVEGEDLYDLQQDCMSFAGRQYGSAKKAMQHKAVEKRKYNIGKRNEQRGRC